ncbi:MAG: TonB family protein [Pseudomonadota bacterium]
MSKIAIVTLLHIGVALALINMKMVVKTAPDQGPIVVTPVPEPKVTPEPANPDLSTKQIEPTSFVPKIDPVTSDPLPNTILAKTLPPGPLPTDTGDGSKTGTDPIGKGITQAPKKIFEVASAGDCARPDYPPRAARLGEEGTVTLALLIGANGRVADAKVSSSSGSRDLDRAAIAALSLCKFTPATTNGVAEPAWGKIAYAWTLE